MNKGTRIIYSEEGFRKDGNPCCSEEGEEFTEELIFDQFIQDGGLMGVTKNGIIRVVDPEKCKIVNIDEYMKANDLPKPFLPEPPGFFRREEKPLLG